jgi:hypothetical protein
MAPVHDARRCLVLGCTSPVTAQFFQHIRIKDHVHEVLDNLKKANDGLEHAH